MSGPDQSTAVRDSAAPRTVARYRIVEELGAGGMGEVYLAVDETLGRRVALKFIKPEHTHDSERVRRFRQEARAASALNHPNILTVYDVGNDDDGRQYIVTEFVDGETLRDRMTRGITLREAVRIVVQIASALSAAHAANVVHRDIKPENVMIRRDGLVKVVDFGLAKLTEPDSATTEDGMIRGTFRYMSPEQARGEPVDARTDLWSLSVVLNEMAGERPGPLLRVIEKGMQKDRAQRYQSADEMIADLQERPPARLARLAVPVAAAAVIAAGAWMIVQRRPSIPVMESRSVAVLPFVNMSADPNNEFLSDGMTEDVINSLAHVADLKVVSRTSSFALKGSTVDLREVAKTLGVKSVVEGSVRKSGDRLRVTARLVDPATGYDLWSDTFDRQVADVFSIQDEIAAAVAQALRTRLVPRVQRPRDLAVYELVVKARGEREKGTVESRQTAIAHLKEALTRDPQFAEGWAELADTYGVVDHLNGAVATLEQTREGHLLALDASNRALAIDPDCAAGHAAVGHILTHDGDFAEAERRLRRALQLNPNSVSAHLWLAVLLRTTGRTAEVKSHLLRARELDPLSIQVANIGSHMFTLSGDFAAAEQFARDAIRLQPEAEIHYLRLARSLAFQGRHAEAEAVLAEASKHGRELADEARAVISAVFGDKEKAHAILAGLDPKAHFATRDLIGAWAAAGDNDRAVALAEKFARDNPSMARVNIDVAPHPVFAALRNDPRYQHVRQQLGLPPMSRAATTDPSRGPSSAAPTSRAR